MKKEASFSGLFESLGNAAAIPYTAATNYFNPPLSPAGQQQQSAVNDAVNRQVRTQTGHDILAAGAGGLGLGILATRLHHILSNLNKPDEKYTKFAPGAHPVDEDEKIALTMDGVAEGIGGTLLSLADPAIATPGNTEVPYSNQQKAWRFPAVLGTSAVGLVLGHKLMASLQAKRKKEELNDTVRQAKKEYERALMGKRGADELDAAFDKIASVAETAGNAALGVIRTPFDIVNAMPGVREMYWAGLLGTGAAAGKMTYDWTRERSRDKAIERARRARARMAGTAPVYVDPEQLVAVKKLVEK
jgi:hypothetical protein